MYSTHRFLSLLLLSLCVFSTHTTANLLIHPTRINLTANDRSQVLTIGNTSSVPATYELSWAEKLALPDGGYLSLDGKETQAKNIASDLVRFSPRRVTLQPGERQSIKLLVRRARGLSDGELRSHLRFKAIPQSADESAPNTPSPSTQINVVLNFAVPVALQIGDYDTAVNITNASIVFDPETGNGTVTTELSRVGKHSAWGDIEAYWTPAGEREVLLAKSAGVNFWTELQTLNKTLSWTARAFKPTAGKLRVVYTGVGKYAGTTYDENTFDIRREDIKPLTRP